MGSKQTNGEADSAQGFSKEEKAAMKARAKELKQEAKAVQNKEAGTRDVIAAIEAMPAETREMGRLLHAIITTNAPGFSPRTWYGMPAYANHEGKIVCFFRGAEKFNERYMTLGFNTSAALDDGNMWPVAYALLALEPHEQERIAALIKKAARQLS